jgi:16S rRNA G527 N7-methylase RsmG
VLKLANAAVENSRIELLPAMYIGAAAAVTVRAVRVDSTLLTRASELLLPEGRLILFRPNNLPISAKSFELIETVQLTDAPASYAATLKRVFHVEQRR